MSDQPEPPGPNPYDPQNPYGTPAQPEQPPQQPPYGQPQYPQPPYGEPQQPPYGQPAYQQNPYQQQPYAQQPYAQQPYGQPYGQQPQTPYGYTPPLPNHPSSNTAMVLGIIGLAGIATCGGITLVLSPFAWAVGSKAVREIDENPGVYGGRGSASSGKIMGIIGTVLLILGILFFAGIIALAIASDSSSTTTYNNT